MRHNAIVLACSFLAVAFAIYPRRRRDAGAPDHETPKHADRDSLRPAPPAIDVSVVATPVSHSTSVGGAGGGR